MRARCLAAALLLTAAFARAQTPPTVEVGVMPAVVQSDGTVAVRLMAGFDRARVGHVGLGFAWDPARLALSRIEPCDWCVPPDFRIDAPGRAAMGAPVWRNADCDAECCDLAGGTFRLATLVFDPVAGDIEPFPLQACGGGASHCEWEYPWPNGEGPVICTTGSPAGCAGDAWPSSGDGAARLSDVVHLARIARGDLALTGQALVCGDLSPGRVTCEGLPAGWCGAGDGVIAADDVVVARRLVAGALQTACAPCVAEPVPAMGQVPGDVAPALSQDGVVTIGDAVLALRWAVGLEPPPPIVGRSADVAPLTPAGDAGGDGVVRIDDVVLILRAAVGLSTLQWPERTLTLHVDALGPFVALMGSTAWPSNVAVPRILSSGCDMSVSGIDRTERWTLTCVTDPVSSPASVDLAVLGYRAADPVNADWLTGEAVAVDLALGTLHAELSLR